MKKSAILALAALALCATLPVATASALSLAPLGPEARNGDIVKVADGCGRFRHWSWRWRRCVLN